MIGWLIGRLRWLMFIGAIGGPFLAYTAWEDAQRLAAIADHGTRAEARITGATKHTSKRGRESYSLDLAWSDKAGAERTSKVYISNDFSQRVIVNDKIAVASLPIRYLEEDADKTPLVVDDRGRQGGHDDTMMMVGGGVGLASIIGLLLMFGVFRRRASN